MNLLKYFIFMLLCTTGNHYLLYNIFESVYYNGCVYMLVTYQSVVGLLYLFWHFKTSATKQSNMHGGSPGHHDNERAYEDA